MKILNHPNIGKLSNSILFLEALSLSLFLSVEMFGNVAHRTDCSGGLSNPLCRNSLCFSQSRHTAPIQTAERLLPAAQKHSCMPLCVPLLSIHHLTACTCLSSPRLMMSSLCGPWPLTHPNTLIGPQRPPSAIPRHEQVFVFMRDPCFLL